MNIKDERKENLLKELAEKKKSDEALLKSEERLRLIINQFPAILWTTDTELKFTSSTGAGLDNLGLNTSQVVGMTLFEYLQTDDPDNLVIKAFRQAIKGNTVSYKYEWKERFFDCCVKPLQNEKGSIIGTIGFALDITDHHHMEESLRESRERFRGLVETTSDWIWEVNENAVYTYVSPKVSDILGYEPEEILGRTPFSLMPPKEAKRVADIFSPFASSHKPFKELENINLHKDGRLVVLETSGVPIFDRYGKFCGYRGIDRDITDRKKAEVAIESISRFPSENPSPVLRISADKTVLYKNEACDLILKNNGLSEKDIYKILPENLDDIIHNALKNNQRIYALEVPLRDEVYSYNLIPVIKHHYVNLYGRDITDRKLAENKLRMTANELRESNITMKVLLKQRENDKKELEEKILSNVKHIIMPYIEKLKTNKSMSEELAYLNILESNLREIVSPFSSRLSFKSVAFTPKEIMVANLIVEGKQDKDIAELLNISIDTVKFHRKNIRKKLGIYGKRKNLQSQLLSLMQ